MESDLIAKVLNDLGEAGRFALQHGARSIWADAASGLVAGSILFLAGLIAFVIGMRMPLIHNRQGEKIEYEWTPQKGLTIIIGAAVLAVGFGVIFSSLGDFLEPVGAFIRRLVAQATA